MGRKIAIEDMQELARKRGGSCLSKEYVNSKTKLRWRCKEGHIWMSSPSNVKSGQWCPSCVGRKLTIEEMRDLARKRGGKCLSKEYINSLTKLQWRCQEGHVWMTDPANVKKGTWCPICADRKLTIEDMRNLAWKQGGKCLSKEYVNVRTKLRWKCKEDHVWMALPHNVRKGMWCPTCADRRLTIEDMQELARKRRGKCLSREYVNNKTKLRWRCKEGHIWMSSPSNVKSGQWCPSCADRLLTIEEMRELARKRGGKCLSKEYVNARTKLKWKCKEGHVWMALPVSVKRGQWCPLCGRKQLIDSLKLTIEAMWDLARKRGGKCLSKEYTNNQTKLRWKCKKGHVWMTKPINVKKGTWCPDCAKNRKLNIEDMQELAERRLGKCLSKKYKDNKTQLKWKCAEGHTWWAAPTSIKNCGTWCPECAVELRRRARKKKRKQGVKVLLPSDFTE